MRHYILPAKRRSRRKTWGHYSARRFIRRVLPIRNQFRYVDRRLTTGIVSPRVSSFIERMMRELARRLKQMTFGWTKERAARMAKIIIGRFASANQWETYWQKRLSIQENVILLVRSIIVTSPQPTSWTIIRFLPLFYLRLDVTSRFQDIDCRYYSRADAAGYMKK